MARVKQKLQIIQMTVAQFEAAFPDEEACDNYLVAHRWPTGVVCPRCGSAHVYKMTSMPFKWECMDCTSGTSYRFSHLVGTIFENTNVELRKWFRVIHLMLTSKKGISARQVHRYMGFGSYKTAWYMCHRIRSALVDHNPEQLGGIVEVDETFVGGKSKNRHKSKRGGHTGNGDDTGRGGIGSGKAPVIGAISRKGNVVARAINSVGSEELAAFVRMAVSNKVSLLVTDEWVGYKRVGKEYPHEIIRHTHGQYVNGAIHTNTIEGFWSIFKRGVVGTFHKVSRKYLSLYVAEFEFRHNNRANRDIFADAISRC
jgi:transposase-like protein